MHYLYLISPGPRPFGGEVVEHLWGPGCDYDSDRNADQLFCDGWTELTVALRPECEKRVDIDPLDDREPLILVIRSERETLARQAATFLQTTAGGELSDHPPLDRSGAL
jgi:hypothetical protein